MKGKHEEQMKIPRDKEPFLARTSAPENHCNKPLATSHQVTPVCTWGKKKSRKQLRNSRLKWCSEVLFEMFSKDK